MKELFDKMYIWSEVWGPLIPLVILLFKKKQPVYFRPVIVYLCIALILNFIGDVIGDFRDYLPHWLRRNVVLYNINSIVRFSCFSTFFLMLKQPFFKTGKWLLPLIFILFILIDFSIFEPFNDPKHLSGNLFTVESFLLIIYCMQYYFFKLKEEDVFIKEKDFWIVTGLCLFVTANFFIFLFYVPMTDLKLENDNLADKMWDVHDLFLVIFCILIAIGFYEPIRNKLTV